MRYLLLLILLLGFMPAQADITGLWRSVDDETGEARSIIEIYKKNDMYYGQVKEILDPKAATVCRACEGEQKDTPIVGMLVMTDMQLVDGQYVGGMIFDPAKAKVYRCKLWLENGRLKVRGYLGFLYRTQTWYRVQNPTDKS